jgi:hypothetical protein
MEKDPDRKRGGVRCTDGCPLLGVTGETQEAIMSRLGKWLSVVVVVTLTWGATGCGGKQGGAPPPSSPRMSPPAGAPAEGAGFDAEAAKAAPPPPAAAYGQPGATPATAAEAAGTADIGRARQSEPSPDVRPGLGTAWGETVESRTTTAPFIRDSSAPFAVATLWYNDRAGAEAMARWADYRSYDRSSADVMGGALTVSLRNDAGNVLPGFFAGGKQYVVGEAGQRYVIVIRNNTNYRYECVASVDGLDVIDGTAAAYTKRGYLIQPYGVLEIDGFRRSADAVAAFRFSSVRGSYASRSGAGDQNVGVIGVAFFNEQGTRPTWTPDEIQRRHNADPFPGRYAVPPPN